MAQLEKHGAPMRNPIIPQKTTTSGMEEVSLITGKNGVTTRKHGATTRKHGATTKLQKASQGWFDISKTAKKEKVSFLKHGATQKYLAPSGVYIIYLCICGKHWKPQDLHDSLPIGEMNFPGARNAKFVYPPWN